MTKTKILLCIFFMGFFALFSHSQTLTYQVDGDDFYSNECGDCGIPGRPDFFVFARVNDQVNSAWSSWDFEEDSSDRCGWFNLPDNTSWRNDTQGNNSTVITVQLDAYEEDPFGCGSDDGDCNGFQTVSTSVVSSRAPCTWHTMTGSRTCEGVLWQVRYRYYYTYNDLLPGSVSNASGTFCQSVNPSTILNVTDATTWANYQWEVSTNGVTWAEIAGQTNVSYNPPLLTQTTSYRRRANDCRNRTRYSNVVTYEVNNGSTPYTSLASPTSTDICSGQSIILEVAGGTNGTGATTDWYSDAGLTNQVGTGNPFNTGALTASQTYYVVRDGDCNTTSAFEVNVNVEYEPSPYTTLVSPNPAVVCDGQQAVIEVSGGW